MNERPDALLTVWDLPTRLFHWALAALAIALLVTGKIGGDALEWHARCGYAVAALLLFRVCWGFAGGHWSRFASFPPSLARAWAWRRTGAVAPGHNPLGAFSVYAMLAFLALQAASGLFSQTKEDFAGPLATLVSNATARLFTAYHRNVGQVVLIVLVALHLLAIGWYAWRGQPLVRAMVTGRKRLPAGTTGSRDDTMSRLRAAAIMSLCSLAVWGIVKLGG